MVEVGGIEPPSLSNQIKAATCLVSLLILILRTPVDRIAQEAAFLNFAPTSKANRRSYPT